MIERAIATLPPQQRRVMQVFLSHYLESASLQTLTALVSAASGRPETWLSVKHALQYARAKLRAALCCAGYGSMR